MCHLTSGRSRFFWETGNQWATIFIEGPKHLLNILAHKSPVLVRHTCKIQVHFILLAASMSSSLGTVSFTNRMVFCGSDHMNRSGRSNISMISLGNLSSLSRSTLMVEFLPGERTFGFIFWEWGMLFSPALTTWIGHLAGAEGLLLASCLHDSATSASFLNPLSCRHL